MRIFFSLLFSALLLTSCIPAKKYNQLVKKEKDCQEELQKYKTMAIDSKAKLKTVEAKLDLMQNSVQQLKEDTTKLGQDYRVLQAQYKQALSLKESFASKLDKIKDSDAKHLARMQANLNSKILEVQHKEDELSKLEDELKKKEKLLIQREKRVNELEEIIQRQKEAVHELKSKIAEALIGFKNKGLKVTEKNGKIYVSMEAKLLFPSGSTAIESEGKKAIIKLAKAIEDVKDLEIIVEGHTDTDRLTSGTHPKNNWELSVLRATSVIDIMLENSNVNPSILTASGRSEFHPINPDDKAKNRRIEVIIAPKLEKLYKLISE